MIERITKCAGLRFQGFQRGHNYCNYVTCCFRHVTTTHIYLGGDEIGIGIGPQAVRNSLVWCTLTLEEKVQFQPHIKTNSIEQFIFSYSNFKYEQYVLANGKQFEKNTVFITLLILNKDNEKAYIKSQRVGTNDNQQV